MYRICLQAKRGEAGIEPNGELTRDSLPFLRRAIVGAGARSLTVRVAGLFLSYAANVLLSRLLGAEQYGEYSIALSWALTIALPAKAGFDNSALRYSTIYLENRDHAALRGFIRLASTSIFLASACIAGLILAVGSSFISLPRQSLLWSALLVFPLALLAFYSVLLRTTGRVAAGQFYEQILRPGLIIIGASAFVVAGSGFNALLAIQLTTVAAFGALLASGLNLRLVLRSAVLQKPDYGRWREWLTVSMPMLLVGVVQETTNQIDILLLGQLADNEQAALFAASWRIASLVPFALIALSMLGAPLVASAYARRSFDELHHVSKLVARMGFVASILAALTLMGLGGWLLSWFGPAFTKGTPVLYVLLMGGVINAFTGIVSYFMTMTGRERHALVIYIVALSLSILFNLLLIPRYGAVGAAVASTVATASWNIAMLIYVRRTIGIDASAVALTPVRRLTVMRP